MIITLCGSARFEAWYHIWNKALTLSGHCVFGLGSYPSREGSKDWYTEEDKAVLDAVHKGKISASHAILVLNVGAYIGESTLSEVVYAKTQNKDLHFLESWGEGLGISDNHSEDYRDSLRKFFVQNSTGIAYFPASPIDTYGHHSPWTLLPEAGERRNRIVHWIKSEEKDAMR